MSNTPEGRVKKKIINILKGYGDIVKNYHIPGSRYGRSGAPDYVCCVRGHYLAIEVKAGTPQTELQQEEQKSIEKACGLYLLIDEDNLHILKETLDFIVNRDPYE